MKISSLGNTGPKTVSYICLWLIRPSMLSECSKCITLVPGEFHVTFKGLLFSRNFLVCTMEGFHLSWTLCHSDSHMKVFFGSYIIYHMYHTNLQWKAGKTTQLIHPSIHPIIVSTETSQLIKQSISQPINWSIKYSLTSSLQLNLMGLTQGLQEAYGLASPCNKSASWASFKFPAQPYFLHCVVDTLREPEPPSSARWSCVVSSSVLFSHPSFHKAKPQKKDATPKPQPPSFPTDARIFHDIFFAMPKGCFVQDDDLVYPSQFSVLKWVHLMLLLNQLRV